MLTPSEVEKLPQCKFTDIGKCDNLDYPKVDLKHCVMCCYEGIHRSLSCKNSTAAMYDLGILMKILRELDAIPKEANP